MSICLFKKSTCLAVSICPKLISIGFRYLVLGPGLELELTLNFMPSALLGHVNVSLKFELHHSL